MKDQSQPLDPYKKEKKVTAFKGVGLFLGADRPDTTVILLCFHNFNIFERK